MVRATFAGFSTALSAIQANQKRLDVTGQNLSNMNTPGYTRQQLEVSSLNYTRPVSHYMNGSEVVVGFGVHMDKVSQIRDPFLDAQYRNQIKKSGYTDAMQTSLDRLADIFDETKISGIRQAFDNIQQALNGMQDPAKVNDPVYESELRSKMQALTNLLNDASKQLTESEKAEFSRLDGTGTNENGAVQEINRMLQQIGTLNRQIKQNQILGQQSLELMDERNLLLDELASYIPIEVTYYKDKYHDGLDDTGKADAAYDSEVYNYNGDTRLDRKEWPDDLRVELLYQDENGDPKRLLLVEGTAGTGNQNYGQLDIIPPLETNDPFDAKKIELTVTPAAVNKFGKPGGTSVTFKQDDLAANTNQFPSDSGSVQASLDMLWKDGVSTGRDDVKGYQYYRNEIDKLAASFAAVMNSINIEGNDKDPDALLLVNKTGDPAANEGITAANIGINDKWSSGDVHVGKHGESATDTVLNLLEAMTTTFPTQKDFFKDIQYTDKDGNKFDINLRGNSFADYMNHVSTILANDSRNNSDALKTNITVLNGIQNSRDSISGVSLNEEASNMMMYMSAYNAASRLMTTLDDALNTLINGTGLVGR